MNIEKETEKEFIDLINNHQKTKSSKRPKPIIAVLTGLIIACLIYFGVNSFFSGPQTGPQGKILSPLPGTTTSEYVSVTIETQNIGVGQYVWLTVDKPRIGLCWPKKSSLESNILYRLTIHEGGPNEAYTLSLYLVNKTINDQWQEWVDRDLFGGLPMLPKRKQLDSVVLILGS